MKSLFSVMTFFVVYSITSCSSGNKISPKEMLAFSGREVLPSQSDYPDDGAVILYDDYRDELYLDGDWNVNVKATRHRAILYFNDKAENWTTFSVYLDPDMSLTSFYGRTIKPNGEILELTEKDLHPTKLQEDFVAFSDDQSVKFTFPGVGPGSILEYSYTINKHETFYGGGFWPIQLYIPKLYTRFTVELPDIFFRHNNNWTYFFKNIELGEPQILKNIVNQKSDKNRSRIFYWEVMDVPKLKQEPNDPPYRDIAQYADLDLRYKDWNELTEKYWRRIKSYFIQGSDSYFKELAIGIVGDADDEQAKIKRVFGYTQQKYRYLATNIGESGYIPNQPKDIITNKYGDCKDMTVLNTTLLNALGIEAHPALVNTKSNGTKPLNLISLDFNHMITYVKTTDGKEFWLDATGSSCPIGEVYSSIEGVEALVIFEDGKSKFIKLPASKCEDNKLERLIKIQINENGDLSGIARILFTGNENISFRGRFKDASKKDMNDVVEHWLNANTPDLIIDSLVYDDPSEIKNNFSIKIHFHKDGFASQTGRLLIFKPNIFQFESELDRYRDEKRAHPIVFNAPYQIVDEVEIRFDNAKYEIESLTKSTACRQSFGAFTARSFYNGEEIITFKQSYSQKHTKVAAGDYDLFRDIQKAIAQAGNENIVLRKK